MTTAQIRNQTKTVTRRVGWVERRPGPVFRLQVGELVQPIEKGQGLKAGEGHTLIGAPIRVVSVRREPLSRMRDHVAYGIEECQREGFGEHPDLMWPSSFVEYFANGHGCAVDADITRIEFEYTVTLEAAQLAFERAHINHLHRRAGEEFEREPSDLQLLDWLTCGGCGERTLVRALRELSTTEATAALSRVFEQQIGRVSR